MNRRTLLRVAAAVGGFAVAGCAGRDDDQQSADITEPGDSPESPPEDQQSETRKGQSATESTATDTLSESEVVELSGPPCVAIDGATFRSTEKQPGGLGPEGTPDEVHWEVSFDGGQYKYVHTDVFESDSYSCTVEDGRATLTAERGDRTYTGTYDPATGVLTWDGVRYRPVEGT